MRVLIACEFSGVVRQAFRALGHAAWSCDLLPAEDGSEFHIQGDCLPLLTHGWDLLIAHPPCTYLCNSGVRWLFGGKGNTIEPSRWEAMLQAAQFFNRLLESGIPRICIENPIPHKYARELIGPYSMTLQPWQHGHGETKRTCLWLRNLPALEPSCLVLGRSPKVHHASPGPDRWKLRSRSYEGIARAMANQWGQIKST